MKVVLCALNAKYVHTNLAVRYIAAYTEKHAENISCHIVEETIHTDTDTVTKRILSHAPGAVAFSCYIWNISEVLSVCRALKSIRPDIPLILGGPEVSYNAEAYTALPEIDYVVRGEGEKPVCALLSCLNQGTALPEHMGICSTHMVSDIYTEADLSSLESPYTEEYLSAVRGKLAYFEASRGCPFSCAFCLSGGCRGVRNFPMEYVKASLLSLWNSGAKTVKFVDRTFNADRKRADEIISFIMERAENMPRICFHFEIAADILADSTVKLLSRAPKGLFQIEAGIQSFHEPTLLAVTRKNSTDKVCKNVKKILAAGNIHTHVDLIAGLPYENLETFRESFHKAYALGAHMLQLGFLKLLHGSTLRAEKDRYGFVFEENAPYTVRSTHVLSEADMEVLENVEDANEKIANSHRFERSLSYVTEVSGVPPFDLFRGFGKRDSMPLDSYTNELFAYFSSLPNVDKTVLRDLMCQDRFETNNSGKLPSSLKVKDPRLGDAAHILEETRPKNVKRAVCILYSKNQVMYADYKKGDSAPYPIRYTDLQTLCARYEGIQETESLVFF